MDEEKGDWEPVCSGVCQILYKLICFREANGNVRMGEGPGKETGT